MRLSFKKVTDITSRLLIEILLVLIFVFGVRSLYFSSTSVLFFWIGYLCISCVTILNVASRSSTHQKLLSIILYSLSLHLIVPLVQPSEVLWDHDVVYTYQTSRVISKQKFWEPGMGTGNAYKIYSNYPILPILQTCLSYTTSIDMLFISKYLMLIYSPITICIIFLFMRKMTGSPKLGIFSAFFFTLNPVFEYLTSYTAYQGLGYICFFIILFYLNKKQLLTAVLFVLFSMVLAMTHHWTSYNLLLFMVSASLLFYLAKGRSLSFRLDIQFMPALFLLVVVFMWQTFVSTYTISWQTDIMSHLLNPILQFATGISGELTHSFGPKGSLVERFFDYLGLAVFVCIGLVGSIISLRRKRRFEAFMYFFGLAMGFVNYYLLPWQIFPVSRGIRNRLLDYAYLYTIPAAICGISQIKKRLLHRPRMGRKGMFIFSLLLLLMALPTVIFLYPDFYYTANSSVAGNVFESSLLWSLTAKWAESFVSSKIEIYGTHSAYVYIGGLAVKEVNEAALPDFLHQISLNDSEHTGLVFIQKSILEQGRDVYFSFDGDDYHILRSKLNVIYSNYEVEVYHYEGKTQ